MSSEADNDDAEFGVDVTQGERSAPVCWEDVRRDGGSQPVAVVDAGRVYAVRLTNNSSSRVAATVSTDGARLGGTHHLPPSSELSVRVAGGDAVLPSWTRTSGRGPSSGAGWTQHLAAIEVRFHRAVPAAKPKSKLVLDNHDHVANRIQWEPAQGRPLAMATVYLIDWQAAHELNLRPRPVSRMSRWSCDRDRNEQRDSEASSSEQQKEEHDEEEEGEEAEEEGEGFVKGWGAENSPIAIGGDSRESRPQLRLQIGVLQAELKKQQLETDVWRAKFERLAAWVARKQSPPPRTQPPQTPPRAPACISRRSHSAASRRTGQPARRHHSAGRPKTSPTSNAMFRQNPSNRDLTSRFLSSLRLPEAQSQVLSSWNGLFRSKAS